MWDKSMPLRKCSYDTMLGVKKFESLHIVHEPMLEVLDFVFVKGINKVERGLRD